MKKLVVYLCVVMLVLGLVGCGSNEEADMEEGDTGTESVEQSSQVQDTSEQADVTQQQEEDSDASDLVRIRKAVVEVLGTNYWPNTQVPPEYLEEYGLTSDMYEEFFGEMPMISTNVDTLIVVKAKDGQVEAVENALAAYREALVEDTSQYPMNVGKIQASRMETFGNYVCFVQLGADTTAIYGENSDEEAVIKHCQEQNELAIEAISKSLGQ